MSELALRLIAENKKTKAKYLDLGNCGLTTLPSELGECVWLEELVLGKDWPEYNRNKKRWLPRTSLNKSQLNLITSIEVLEKLKGLKKIVLTGQYEDIWPLSDLSPLANLVHLKELYCGLTKVSDLQPISKLYNLSHLYFYGTKVADLKPIAQLSKLTQLNFSSTQVTDLHPIDKLSNLTHLYFHNTNVTNLNPVARLSELTQLNCSNTLITDLNPIGRLSKLTHLYFFNTQVTNLNSITGLSNLTHIHFYSTPVSDIFPLLPLIKKRIPVNWKTYGKGINIENCPLIHPPIEIAKQGNAAIINYFEELERAKAKNEVIRLAEAKCLILGEGGAGKTSLARKLIDPTSKLPAEEDTTKGIEVHPLDIQLADGTDFRLNIWDFGGQEVYHATHQFFLTKRSLYLLLDDTRKDEKTVNDPVFNYWLQIAQLYGGNSPLLIVQNEKGGRSKELDLGGMQARFSFVKDVKATNLLDGQGLEQVWTAIQYWLQQLPHIGEEQPKVWVDVRRELERLAQEERRDHISLQEYLKICEQHKLSERKRALFLSSYLHDFGAFLHFQDHPLLRKTLVLNNQWATDAVYKVLDCEAVKDQHGRFDRTTLANIWGEDRYADQHPELLALMEKFELCYQLQNEKTVTWLAPQLLSVIRPKTLQWDESNNLQIRYEYEFMPRGLLSQHIVRMHRYLRQPELAWKSGVIFERETAQALVTEEWGVRKINLRARGPQAKELLTILSEDFDVMHERLEGLQVRKMIPCCCTQCTTSSTPHFYDYQNLNTRRQKEKNTVECQISYEDVNVAELLDGIFSENIIYNQTNNMGYYEAGKTRVFISYSKTDIQQKKTLLKQLRPLRNKISVWHDHLILPGQNWDEAVKGALSEADIVLLLVSANSISTDYVQEVELPIIKAREAAGECIFVPVILNFCYWEILDFAKHNALPSKGIPITADSWRNEDEAWLRVVQGIDKLIE